MRIVNIMLGKGLGGLEQVAIDYHEALTTAGHEVTTILRKGAKIAPPEDLKSQFHYLSLLGFAPLIRRNILKICAIAKPDVILLHGNKPLKFIGPIKTPPSPRIFIAHNYRTKPLVQNLEGVIAVSTPVKDHIISTGYPEDQIHVVNNMTDMQKVERPEMDEACPKLGMLTRLHPVKGVDLFLEALGQLKEEGIKFEARIAGDGPEKENLIDLAKKLNIHGDVEFVGWVHDKATFFQSIDILCAPSRSEAFPVLVVEAISAGIPLIVTDLKGPCSILSNKEHALIVPVENATAISEAIKDFIKLPELRSQMQKNQNNLAENFTKKAVTEKLTKSIKKILGKFENNKY